MSAHQPPVRTWWTCSLRFMVVALRGQKGTGFRTAADGRAAGRGAEGEGLRLTARGRGARPAADLDLTHRRAPACCGRWDWSALEFLVREEAQVRAVPHMRMITYIPTHSALATR